MLLPSGASCTCPSVTSPSQFFLLKLDCSQNPSNHSYLCKKSGYSTCLYYFSDCYDKDQTMTLKEGTAYFGSQFEGTVRMGKVRQQEHEATGHIVSGVEKQKEEREMC